MRPDQKNKSKDGVDVEPSAAAKIPKWLIFFSAILICLASVYVYKNSKGFDAQVFQPFHSRDQLAKAQPVSTEGLLTQQGLEIYSVNCAICHQANGMGDPQKAPPLPGAEWVLTPGPNRIIRILLDGFTGPVNIRGEIWNLNMPAWKNNLNDEQIAAVLSYVRNEWGNQAPEIHPDQVKKVREQTKTRNVPWTAEELIRVPEM